MGILNFLKLKKKNDQPKPQNQSNSPSESRQIQRPVGASSKKSPKSLLFLLIGLLVGCIVGAAIGGIMPEMIRDVLSLEPLVPQSELLQLQAQLKREKAKSKPSETAERNDETFPKTKRQKTVAETNPPTEPENFNVRQNRRIQRPTQDPMQVKEKQEVQSNDEIVPDPGIARQNAEMRQNVQNDEPVPPQRRNARREYIDEMGTQTTPGKDILRTNDLPIRTVIPSAMSGEPLEIDYSKIRFTPQIINRLTSITDNGIHFYLRPDCDYCSQAYAIATNLHLRYPDMPIGITFFIQDAKQVLMYGAWNVLRLVNEEEAWNLLNHAFNSPDKNDSQKILQTYENMTPQFHLDELIRFWREHREELKLLLDRPYEIQHERGLDSYKVPLVTVFGKIQGQDTIDVESLRRAYLGRIQTDPNMRQNR